MYRGLFSFSLVNKDRAVQGDPFHSPPRLPNPTIKVGLPPRRAIFLLSFHPDGKDHFAIPIYYRYSPQDLYFPTLARPNMSEGLLFCFRLACRPCISAFFHPVTPCFCIPPFISPNFKSLRPPPGSYSFYPRFLCFVVLKRVLRPRNSRILGDPSAILRSSLRLFFLPNRSLSRSSL